ncbi:restriction endonuclease subunit S [Enterococcus casseliflavus]
MSNDTQPEIRFPGFTDDWEERKLLDNVDKVLDYRGKSPTKFGMEWGTEGYLVLSALNVKNGYIDKSVEAKYGDQELFERWMGSNRLEKGDVLFTTEAPLGNVAQVPDDNGYILNQRAVAFKSSKDTDNNFFAQLLRSPIVQNTLNANSSGGTAKGIGMKEFAKLNAHVPKTFEEQQKIGTFFKQLDHTIALHQRKLDLLKETKKGFLQKMFPKNGAKVPEIRFPGFTGDWEERKLETLFEKGGSGGTPKSTNPDYYRGDIPFLGISDISNSNGYIKKTEKSITLEGLNNSAAWIVPKGAISLAMYASVGKLSILNIDVATSQAFYNMVFNDDRLRDFVYQRLSMANDLGEWIKLISTGTQANLNADKVKNFVIQLPSNIEEIGKIGSFLNQIDNTIILHQRKLDLLKETKKGFLQKMFV